MHATLMNGFELYFHIITLACGVYAAYTALKLRKLGKLFANQLLIPKDATPEQCLDEEGYVSYVAPRLLVLGVLLVLAGGICLANSQLHLTAMLFAQPETIDFYVEMGGIVLCLLSLVWYMICWSKGRKLYWV